MRSEKEVYDIVLNFAKTDKRIRMVTLEGSRTNTNIPPDDFQDFDITFFVTDMDSFTSDDKWLDIFGERLILQKPEDMELFPAVEKGFSYLMLFTDDVKIDLTLLPLSNMQCTAAHILNCFKSCFSMKSTILIPSPVVPSHFISSL